MSQRLDAPSETTREGLMLVLRGATAAGPYLLVVDGPQTGRRIPLAPELSLGRGRQAAIRFPDPELSRLHAQIRTNIGTCTVEIEDLDSKNGVYLNGERLPKRRARLHPGDQLAVGSITLKLIAPANWSHSEEPEEREPATLDNPLLLASAAALLAAAIGLAAAMRAMILP